MKKSILIALSILALPVLSFAETWSYDPDNPENNTKDSEWRPSVTPLTIDVSEGTLTVTGIFENKGTDTTVVGSNTTSALSDYKFSCTGSYIQNHGVMTLVNANVNSGGLYNENTNSAFYVQGVSSVYNMQTKNNAKIVIEDGAKLTSNNFEVYSNGTMVIENAKANTFTQSWEFKTQTNGLILANFSNDTLACVDKNSAVMNLNFAKTLNADIALDFTDIVLDDETFIAGNTYKIALVYCKSNQYAAGQFDDSWKVLAENVIESDIAKFAGFEKDNNFLYINLQAVAVPEPATFAAVFGALAIAFAAYRRRK